MKRELLERIGLFLHIEFSTAQVERLQVYHDWLVTEAIPAGGLGPGETERIDTRHIADSLLFADRFLLERPRWVRDIGSGVGLPGIPLAILLPQTGFELVDRSGRRVDLMKRAVRVLDLENVSVIRQDIDDISTPSPVMVSRAVLSPEETAKRAERLVISGGKVVLGGSWTIRPEVPGWETIEIPAVVLDQTVWLLMMRRQ